MTDEFYASFPVETPSEEIEELVAQYGLEVVRMKERPRIGKVGYDFRVSDDSPGNAMETANLFVELGLVLAASPQFLELYSIALGTTLNDQYFSSQWALGPSKLDAANAWDTTTGHPSITIAIIDTGVDEDHEDLNSKLITGRNTWPFWSNSDTDDDEGHGTEVAGIAAAETNMFGNVEVAGVSWASMIMPIKVIDIEEKEA